MCEVLTSGFFGRFGSAVRGIWGVVVAAAHGAKIVGWRPLAKAFRNDNVYGFMMYMLLLAMSRGHKTMLAGETLHDGRIVVSLLVWTKDSWGWLYETGLTLTEEGVIQQ